MSVFAQKKMCDYQRSSGHVVTCRDSNARPQTLGVSSGPQVGTCFIGAPGLGLHSRPTTPTGAGLGYCKLKTPRHSKS